MSTLGSPWFGSKRRFSRPRSRNHSRRRRRGLCEAARASQLIRKQVPSKTLWQRAGGKAAAEAMGRKRGW
jgi:hypothetical protein